MLSVRPIHPSAQVMPLARLGLQDLDALRLLLSGSSVVDWSHLHFESPDLIEAFLRVNELELSDERDRTRLSDLRHKAVTYLIHHLKFRVSELVRNADVKTLFEYASKAGRRGQRAQACMTLKVMHIMHYVEAHELLSMLPISPAEIGILMHAKIEHSVRGLMERNFPIVEFVGNQKPRDSVISKLLAKKETQVAQVFDKLRFRFVVKRCEDIPPLLVAMMRELAPFNYLVPSQAENSLLDIGHMLARAGNLHAIRARKSETTSLNETLRADVSRPHQNDFSGPDYRVVNFVADVPLRVDRVLPLDSARLKGRGRVVFVMVEFQVVDQRTARKNEIGENRHGLYKARQRSRVRQRLLRGRKAHAPRVSQGRSKSVDGSHPSPPESSTMDGVKKAPPEDGAQ